jgi:hypothetical protein
MNSLIKLRARLLPTGCKQAPGVVLSRVCSDHVLFSAEVLCLGLGEAAQAAGL